jgi:hypothetical protein
LKDRGWVECGVRTLTKVEGTLAHDTLTREFQRASTKHKIRLSSSTTLQEMHWTFGATFTGDTPALDEFRVFSYTSLADPTKTACEFLIRTKDWESLCPTEVSFLEKFTNRLFLEESPPTTKWKRSELLDLRLSEWWDILQAYGVPRSTFIAMGRYATWQLLQRTITIQDEMEPIPSREKRRSLSPSRQSAPPKEKITSIFWYEWGKNKHRFPARLTSPDEVAEDQPPHVYFFGSRTITPLEPSRKIAWEDHRTAAVRYQKSIHEALTYATLQLDK